MAHSLAIPPFTTGKILPGCAAGNTSHRVIDRCHLNPGSYRKRIFLSCFSVLAPEFRRRGVLWIIFRRRYSVPVANTSVAAWQRGAGAP